MSAAQEPAIDHTIHASSHPRAQTTEKSVEKCLSPLLRTGIREHDYCID